jgi:hypothetical protein
VKLKEIEELQDLKDPRSREIEIMVNQPRIARNSKKNGFAGASQGSSIGRGMVALALAFCMSGVAQAGQEQQQQGQQQGQQQDEKQAQGQGQDQQQGQTQDGTQPAAKPRPVYPSQDADKPPYAQDRQMQNGQGGPKGPSQNPPYPPQGNQGAKPGQSYPYPPQGGPGGQGDQAGLAAQAAQYAQPVPAALTVPPGTIVFIRTGNYLSSDTSKVGDPFTGTLEKPIVVNGWVVARRGQVVSGVVKEAVRAGKVTGVSRLGVEVTDLTVVDGQQVPVLTELWKASAGTSHGQDAGTIATTTAVGAGIGAAVGWGVGAAIGAGAGAVAGIATVLLTRGHPTILPPETPLSFRLVDPVKIDTTNGQQAFFPVSQEDYDGERMVRRGPPPAGGYPGYPCGPYAPCYAYPGYGYPAYVYPGVAVGFYGWGPRYYGGYYGGYRGGYYGRYGYHR